MHKTSTLDPNQILQNIHDEKRNANRVVLVGGDNLNLNATINIEELSKAIASNLPTNSKENYKIIEVPLIHKELVVKEIQVPTIIKETIIEKVEVPLIHREIEIKEIQVPVVTQKIEKIEVIKEKYSKLDKTLMICETLAIVLLAIVHLIK